jgi:hypothetical protein
MESYGFLDWMESTQTDLGSFKRPVSGGIRCAPIRKGHGFRVALLLSGTGSSRIIQFRNRNERLGQIRIPQSEIA